MRIEQVPPHGFSQRSTLRLAYHPVSAAMALHPRSLPPSGQLVKVHDRHCRRHGPFRVSNSWGRGNAELLHLSLHPQHYLFLFVPLPFLRSSDLSADESTAYWDMCIDFQLGQRQAPSYLREILAFNSLWWYKSAIIINPILRMTWIFFVIFDPNIQHSNIVSFVVALVEVFRRGLWVVFRVESEHCANIARQKASRDLPSPGGL
jgi:hypothetical protein